MRVFTTESGLPPPHPHGLPPSGGLGLRYPAPGLGSSPASSTLQVSASDSSGSESPFVPRRRRKRLLRSSCPSGRLIATSTSEGVDV
eukprot:2291446-Prorocentrum_lima.AAC.1